MPDVEADGYSSTEERTPLLNMSPSDASLEIAKRDTSESYRVVAWNEMIWITLKSSQTAVALMLEESFFFVNVMSVSHLGANELAAMSLSVSCTALAILAPVQGYVVAMGTFCSTAYTASSDKTLVGFHLQRGLIAIFLHLLLMIPFLWNAERVLLALGQEPVVAHLSGTYLRIQILGMAPLAVFEACKRYLQAQGIMSASTFIVIGVAPIHWISNFFLVRSTTYGIGFVGAPIATVMSNWLMFVGIIVYILKSRANETWGGWNARAFGKMSEFYKLGISSVCSSYAGWIGFELLTISASYFGAIQLSGQAIMLNTVELLFQFSMGLGSSTTARVGNLIGAGKPRQARISGDMAFLASAAVGAIGVTLLLLFGDLWTSVYTTDPEIARVTTMLMPVACIFIISDGMNAIGGAILRGLGRQYVNASTYTIGLYCVGVPVAAFLAYRMHMGVLGLWWGLCAGVITASTTQLIYIKTRVNWKNEVLLCLQRLLRSGTHEETESDTNTS
ncbi:MATE efflux family protein [Coemansia reversa NRRL 1564]|uniref:MATE efflux family protein n=1 Tax=Coemansia reversa (strain ATCC 12441 / NRRL 1564) TaxID=763665 RepID=A0A2G5B322_COERN|nr:MATE efflux family protein [Coemansia reversa NRRL 1564]|eukprot:PIA13429.1 MATE efflux family protein [Coemansia reversa NRRL 1564]